MAVINKPISLKGRSRWARSNDEGLLSSIGRYTRFVVFSKMFLAILSLVMIVTIIVLPVLNADEEGLRIAFSTIKEKTDSLPVMTKPTFQGVDEKNQPYLITADSAIQHDENTIVVNRVQADLLTENETWLSVQADSGTINTLSKTLNLNGHVKLFQDQGYEFSTDSVEVDMNTRVANGTKPISGFGPAGQIQGGAFSWDHTRRVLTFTNGVKLRIRNNG